MATYYSPSHSQDHLGHHGQDDEGYAEDGSYEDDELLDPDTVSVHVLVEHWLAARRATSAVQLMWRASTITDDARQLFEESLILDARTAFLKRGLLDGVSLIKRIQHGMTRTLAASKKELIVNLIPTMNRAGAALTATMEQLKTIAVDPVFRLPGEEEPKYLFDFVSDDQVETMVSDLKDGLGQMGDGHDSFGKLLDQFDSEVNELTDTLSSVSESPTDPHPDPNHPENLSIMDLLESITEESHRMAGVLTELTDHHDACVRAVRLTEGGTDLAEAKVAEGTDEAGPGISDSTDVFEAMSRAEAVTRVMRDADRVQEAVADVHEGLREVDMKYSFLKDQSHRVKVAWEGVTLAVKLLEAIRLKVEGYHDAANRFVEHSDQEKRVILETLEGMDQLRNHWERYMEAYDSLILEVERRRAVEEKIQSIWRSAKDQVDKLVDKDWADRQTFTEKVGDYIPSDLWARKSGPLQKWEVLLAELNEGIASASGSAASGEIPKEHDDSAAVLSPGIIDGALERPGSGASGQR